MQLRARQQREVSFGVLPGVEHDSHLSAVLPGCGGQGGVPGGQGRDHLRELGDAGLVPGVGVRQQQDAAVAGDHQAEADQPQVRAFLLGLSPLRARALPVSMNVAKFNVDVLGDAAAGQRRAQRGGQPDRVLGEPEPGSHHRPGMIVNFTDRGLPERWCDLLFHVAYMLATSAADEAPAPTSQDKRSPRRRFAGPPAPYVRFL